MGSTELENLCVELRSEGIPAHRGPPVLSGQHVDTLLAYGLPRESPYGSFSIHGLSATLGLGSYFSHEIPIQLPAYGRPDSRNNSPIGTTEILVEGPCEMESFTGRAGKEGKVPLKGLSPADVPDDVWLKASGSEVPDDVHLSRVMELMILAELADTPACADDSVIASEDLRRAFRFLNYEREPRVIRSGRQSYLSLAAVRFNASKAMMDLASAAGPAWKSREQERAFTIHPLYQWRHCAELVTDAMSQMFLDRYAIPFPFTAKALLRLLKEDAGNKGRAGFMVKPDSQESDEHELFNPGDPPPALRWADPGDCMAPGTDLHFGDHMWRRVFAPRHPKLKP